VTTRLRLVIRDELGNGRLNTGLVERLLANLRLETEAVIVTLEGVGEAFCEGLDMELLADGVDSTTALEQFADLLHAIEATPRPVIALVNGPAWGGGVGLAAAADLVLASPRATFGLPEVLFGLVPAMVFPVLVRRVGHARARWLALSAATLTAGEAHRLGLVDELTDDLEGALARHSRRLERLDPRAMAAVKSMAVAHASSRAGYREHAVGAFQHLAASAQTRERIDRFLNGQTPWPPRGET
jgi:polyketide biosynthesis enoyl-CoA hydratase PksH